MLWLSTSRLLLLLLLRAGFRSPLVERIGRYIDMGGSLEEVVGGELGRCEVQDLIDSVRSLSFGLKNSSSQFTRPPAPRTPSKIARVGSLICHGFGYTIVTSGQRVRLGGEPKALPRAREVSAVKRRGGGRWPPCSDFQTQLRPILQAHLVSRFSGAPEIPVCLEKAVLNYGPKWAKFVFPSPCFKNLAITSACFQDIFTFYTMLHELSSVGRGCCFNEKLMS